MSISKVQPLEILTVGQESSLHSQPLYPGQGCLCFSWLNKNLVEVLADLH